MPMTKPAVVALWARACPVVTPIRACPDSRAPDDGYRGSEVTVRQGNARVGRGRHRAADAGHFLKRHACGHKLFGLFAAAPENIGVTALEPGHHLALAGLGHQQGVDLILGQGVVARHLAHINFFRVWPDVVQQSLVGQGVVDHHARRGQGVAPFEGQQAGIMGPAPIR